MSTTPPSLLLRVHINKQYRRDEKELRLQKRLAMIIKKQNKIKVNVKDID